MRREDKGEGVLLVLEKGSRSRTIDTQQTVRKKNVEEVHDKYMPL